jgi:hypothetical protein
MNKETLCIGNLVKHKGEVHEIDGIFTGVYGMDFSVSLKDIDDLAYLDEIEPIPFDESYLERLGFERDSGFWSLKGFTYINGEFYLSSVCIGKLYVHQVQNLLNILIHQPQK